MSTLQLTDDSPPLRGMDDLTAYFRQGEKPDGPWRLGCEQEQTPFTRLTHKPPEYEGPGGIHEALALMGENFGWEPLLEQGALISMARAGALLALEPGGQVELATAPRDNGHQVLADLLRHQQELEIIGQRLGLVWQTLGVNPLYTPAQLPRMPKQRYGIMERYLPTRGARALDMMYATTSVQVSIDYLNEQDMAAKLRLSMALAPIFLALSANSPFYGGQPTGWLSNRGAIWLQTDPDRSGVLAQALAGEMGYQQYAGWALDVPMFFIHREGRLIPTPGQSFRRFLEQGIEGWRATQEDWLLHLTTLFPEVRLKTYLEWRMFDGASPHLAAAYAALVRGLVYDRRALAEGLALVAPINAGCFPQAMEDAARDGLKGSLLNKPLLEWAREAAAIAKGGLARLNQRNGQGQDETVLLEPLAETLEEGRTPAVRMLALYKSAWHNRLEPLFQTP